MVYEASVGVIGQCVFAGAGFEPGVTVSVRQIKAVAGQLVEAGGLASYGVNTPQMSYRAAPQAVIRRVPDTMHFIMYDNPAFFQAQLRTFLTTPGAPRP